MDRELTPWERGIVERLVEIDSPRADELRASVPFLRVTSRCECGCGSFNLRDVRSSPQPHELDHYSNGAIEDLHIGFALWLGPDDMPMSVDIFLPSDDPLVEMPDPDRIVVTPAGPT